MLVSAVYILIQVFVVNKTSLNGPLFFKVRFFPFKL